VRTGSIVAVAASVIGILGVTGGIALAARPTANSGPAASATLPFLHIAVSREIKGGAPRKQAKATCPSGEAVATGGYVLGGPFQSRPKQAPKAVPVVTESVPSVSPSGTLPNEWSVTAVASGGLAGGWTLKVYALCG
jgi:hypothetical protein